MKVYIAGPLFNRAEKDFNLKIYRALKKNGYEIFLPQKDGFEAKYLKNKTEQQKCDLIFNKDIGEIESADVIVMNLDGRVPDDGACVELGYAYAKGKKCYGIKTDTRSLEIDLDLNPLIAGCFIKIFKGKTAFSDFKKYINEVSL